MTTKALVFLNDEQHTFGEELVEIGCQANVTLRCGRESICCANGRTS
jgi:hypothetical protein